MIGDWYGRQSETVQAALDVALEFLAQRPREGWRRPQFDLLSGKMSGIGEIRFKVDGKQYRVLGFFGPAPSEFTMLVGASKKQKNYNPPDALETAVRRMSEVRSDRRCCRVCDL